MGGKSSTSTNSVTIPPEVLARYNAANNAASAAAQTPFQTYNGQFVAPLSQTQEAGVANTNLAAGQAQPYYQAATGQLGQAQASATPYYGAATQAQGNAAATGSAYAGGSLGALAGGNQAAAPYQAAAGQSYGGAYAGAQPYNQAATGLAAGAYAGAQPYNSTAAGLAGASAQAVNPDSLNVGQYLSPYLSTVLQGTEGILNQQNQQAMSGQLGNAITSGAFGGDRSGIAAANLNQQQNLANAQIYSGILNQGYNTALGAAQQQQGLYYDAAAANRGALAAAGQQFQSIGNQQYNQGANTASQLANIGNQTYSQGMGLGSAEQGLGGQLYGQGATNASQIAALGQQQYSQGAGTSAAYANLGQGLYNIGSQTSQQLAGLGAGAQSASLQGAQAQLAAGQTEQQTQQAQDTALYNQFLQQQSYPFQTAQFLANVAEGTGSLSGSTTTTTQPGGFFSDRRLKENVKPIGKTHDGQTIYSYNYRGDPRTQIGLMAQEVEKKHPEAVGLAGGYKTVDYAKATADAARTKRYAGGLVPANDDHLHEPLRRAVGGMTGGFDPQLAAELLSAQKGVYGGAGGPASAEGGPYGGLGRVPTGAAAQHQLQVAQPAQRGPSAMSQAKDTASLLHDAWGAGEKVNSWLPKGGGAVNTTPEHIDTYDDTVKSTGLDPGADFTPAPDLSNIEMAAPAVGVKRGGLIDARHRFAQGGLPYADQETQSGLDIPDDSQKYSLQTAQGKGGPSSGQQDFNDVMDAAKVAAMFMALNRGGRAQRAAGGLAGRKGYNGLDGSFVDGLDDGTGVYDPNDPTDQRRFMIQPGQGSAFAPDTFSKDAPHSTTSGLGGAFNPVLNPTATAALAASNPDLPGKINAGLKAAEGAPRPAPKTGQMQSGPSKQPNLLEDLGNVAQSGLGAIGSGLGAIGNGIADTYHAANVHAAQRQKERQSDPVMYADGNYYSQKDGGLMTPLPGAKVLDKNTGNFFIYGKAPAAQAAGPVSADMKPAAAPQAAASPGAAPPTPGVGHNSRGLNLDRVISNTPTDDTWAKDVGSAHWLNAGSASPDARGIVPNGTLDANTIGAGLDKPLENDQIGTGDPGIGGQPKTGLAGAGAPPPATGAAGDGQHRGFFSGLLHGAAAGLDKYGQPVANLADGATDAAGNVLTGLGRGAMNYSQRLKAGDEQAWVPLLTGLSAMGTAPTRSLGVALATGVGAGAQAYPALQTQQAKLQSQNLANAGAQADLIKRGLLVNPAKDGHGNAMVAGQPVNVSSSIPAINSAFAPSDTDLSKMMGPTSILGNAGRQEAPQSAGQYQIMSPEAKAQSAAAYADATARGAASLASRPSVDTLMTTVGDVIHQPGGTGPYKALATAWASRARQVSEGLRAIGINVPDIPAEAVSDPQIIDKLNTEIAQARAIKGGETAVAALESLRNTVPSQTLDTKANAVLAAGLMTDNQRDADLHNYIQEFKGASGSAGNAGWFNAQRAIESAQKDIDPGTYAREKGVLADLLQQEGSTKGASRYSELKRAYDKASPQMQAKFNDWADSQYGRGFHRYFNGGRW